ncbi:MAG: single-stranded DNA-binding protein [Spirochaetales bacterium]|nr:single-stranded DNA-binding protein [Spirochaetales bacterium]
MAKNKTDSADALVNISRKLAAQCEKLRFGAQAAAVYNPLVYAKKPHELYLKLSGGAPKKVIFLGMNPGPWGMAQTGVPFGEIPAARDWLVVEAAVGKPAKEHPKRPIEGFACAKSEVSGRRLWGLFQERFATPAAFFRDHYVANYCPLVFMDSGGANITPDKLSAEETRPLFEACDSSLAQTIRVLQPEWVIGVGGFAKKRIDIVAARFFADTADSQEGGFKAAQILHPSPANPKANAGWGKAVTQTLTALGVW